MKSLCVAFVLASCAPSGPKDVTEQRRDITTTQGQDGYEYVAKTKHGVVALAESRGVSKDEAKKQMDRFAENFEKCLADLDLKAPLKPGAVRIIVPIDEGGVPSEPQVSKISDATPDTRVTTLVCVIGPAKMTVFSPPGPISAEAGTRGMAIEATWPNSS